METHVKLGIGVLLVGALLTCILVPLSVAYVDRNKVAFRKNTITNDVDTGEVYTNGRYFWGLGKTTVEFNATFTHVEFVGAEALGVFTAKGLEIRIDCSFQYRIRRTQVDLENIFDKYGKGYHSQVVNIARASLRNEAPRYSPEDYISRRVTITAGLQAALQKSLDEIWVDVPPGKFQLRRVILPGQIQTQFLETFLLTERAKEATERRIAELVRKDTERKEEEVRGNITVLRQKAVSVRSRLVEEARAVAVRRLQVAKAEALKSILSSLKITTPNAVNKFLEYTALLDGPGAQLLVGLDKSSAIVYQPRPAT